MNDQDFKSVWQTSCGAELVSIDQHTLYRNLSSKMEELDKTIERRNTREKIVSVLLIVFFCFVAYSVPHTLTKIAALLMIPFYLFYMHKIDSVRRQKSLDFSQPPKEFLLTQKQYLLKEKKLLDTVLYWAVLPLSAILILFYAGFPMSMKSYLGYGGFTLIVFFAVYWFNKIAVRKSFNPLLEKIDMMIREFDKNLHDRSLE